MHREHETVTVTWQRPGVPEPNRLTVSRRAILALGGLLLFSAASAVVLGAVAGQLHGRYAAADRQNRALLAERKELQDRLAIAEEENASARERLATVREEERKIRSWLGLDAEAAAGERAEAAREGGKGSLGDVDLETVAPADRAAEADPEPAPEPAGLGELARTLADDLTDLAARIHERKRYWDSLPAIAPVDGEHWISSGFGWRRSPFSGKREFHSGIDLAGQRGTPVVAPADGRVVRVVRDRALGRSITVDHGNGIETVYGHLDKTLVKRGQQVTRGQEIGLLGSTGKRSTGPHLHYAVKVDGKFVNPKNYLLDLDRLPYATAKK